MAIAKSTNGKRKNGIKTVVEKLQKSLLPGKKSVYHGVEEGNMSAIYVPNDVKQGHFAVVAVNDNELKRFVVPLTYLTNPSFLRLLAQAAEEYGFNHEGALITIHCRPIEFERILAEKRGGRH